MCAGVNIVFERERAVLKPTVFSVRISFMGKIVLDTELKSTNSILFLFSRCVVPDIGQSSGWEVDFTAESLLRRAKRVLNVFNISSSVVSHIR